jgi:hypothetical protein
VSVDGAGCSEQCECEWRSEGVVQTHSRGEVSAQSVVCSGE